LPPRKRPKKEWRTTRAASGGWPMVHGICGPSSQK